MELLKKVNVLVSGASVAGLCTAFWLVKYGFNVVIVERSSHIRAGGQALDVRGPALDVVERMGILDEIRRNGTSLKGMSVIDALSGKEVFSTTEYTVTRGKQDSPDVEILRDDLCRILFNAVGDQVEYIFNDTIVSLHQDSSGVDVTFNNAQPRRFDFLIGADGLRSNVRRLAFGSDEQFTRYLGHYVAIFTIPNFLHLDHWEVVFQHEETPVAALIVKDKDSDARTYLGFSSTTPIPYDYHDIAAQKRLITEQVIHVGADIPKILAYMQDSPNFYFDAMNQIVMDNWSDGRVVLVGDAGYSPSISLGQGTTVAMVGAYVLAGELATHGEAFQTGYRKYEEELRGYVEANQQQALGASLDIQSSISEEGAVPDFSQAVVPFAIKSYL